MSKTSELRCGFTWAIDAVPLTIPTPDQVQTRARTDAKRNLRTARQ